MRYIISGAGAVGGVIGGRLAQHGRDVVLIARGPHLEALKRDGLTLQSAEASEQLATPAEFQDRGLWPALHRGDVLARAIGAVRSTLSL